MYVNYLHIRHVYSFLLTVKNMTINFYLDKKSVQDERIIFAYIRGIAPKKTIVLHTGEYLMPKHWDKEKQQARRSYTGSMELNGRLTALKNEILRLYRTCLTENPNADYETIKEAILSLKKPKVATQGGDLLEVYREFIERKSVYYASNSSNKHKSLMAHLHNFAMAEKMQLDFSAMTLDFYEKFSAFMLNEVAITNNTYGKYLTAFKTFMNWAAERGHVPCYDYKKFKVPTEQVDIIYLTEEELMTLYHLDLSHNKSYERVRDAFCFQCFTGQRFSDIRAIELHDIREGIWYLRTTKTKDALRIPLSKHAQDILKKYKDTGIPSISSQKTNAYLKEIGKLASINNLETITRYRGSERIELTEPKYNFISTHTARRTFVTLSLEKGMRPETIMKITGHKDYKTFKKYIKLTDKVAEQEMRRVWG